MKLLTIKTRWSRYHRACEIWSVAGLHHSVEVSQGEKGVVRDLHAFAGGDSEYVRAEPAAADRQRFALPALDGVGCRAVEPEAMRGGACRNRFCRQERGGADGKHFAACVSHGG